MTADLIIGSLATVISCILLLPQIARLLRTGRTEGVSPVWAALGTVVNGGWLVFVIAERLWVPIISIVGTGAGFGLTFGLLHRKGADVGRGLGVGGAVIVVLVAVGGLSGWAVLGTSLALANIVQFFPSVATAWRTYAPVGLSPVTWMLMLAETAGWTAYGVLVDQMPIVLYGLSGLVASMLMLTRIWITRARDSTRVSDRLSATDCQCRYIYCGLQQVTSSTIQFLDNRHAHHGHHKYTGLIGFDAGTWKPVRATGVAQTP